MSDDDIQELQVDDAIAELRLAKPRDERKLALFGGFAFWLVTTLELFSLSLLFPDMLGSNAWFWRVLLTVYGFAVAVSHITWMRRLPQRFVGTALFISALLAGFTALALMLIAGTGFAAITINLLSAVIFAAYFLPTRRFVTVVSLATLYSLVPLIYDFDAATDERMASRLVVWIPVMWLVGAAIHLQNRERRDAVDAAERQALTDPLTGIANLRALRLQANAALRRGRRDGTRTALLIVDLRQFRDFNIRYGHSMGDAMLCAVAGRLAIAVNKDQLVARIGGDTFAVLIEHVKTGDLADMAVRFQRAVGLARIAEAEDLPPFTATVGTSYAPDDGDSLDDLLTVADRAVHDAKLNTTAASAPAASTAYPNDFSRLPQTRFPQPYAQLGRENTAEEPIWLGRPLNSVFAASGWFLAIALVLASLVMPDADRSQLDVALPVILFAAVPASLDFFFTPRIGSARHLFNDFLTLALLGVITYLTGGGESAAWPFVFIVLAHSGWFVSAPGLALRTVGAIMMILAPLAYDGFGGGPEQATWIVALYGAVVVALLQSVAMGVNRYYMERAEAVAQRMARLDPLTYLPNRYAFKRFAGERIEQLPEPAEDVLAVVILDLHGLSGFNGAFGHGAGDALLCEIARRLQKNARDSDLIARIGDGEFGAVMYAHGERDAHALAERLVHTVDECVDESHETAAAHVSACAGFALYPTYGRTVDELTGAADLALLSVATGGHGSRVSGIVMRV